ncbi:hypothetical protein [Dictyobacter kobayashii]|uniref:Uncharacterized protein n=1 Tax=Dictyobacter kobayashii TaxID=2014872 RepID=A0A402AGX0_9CHLR|nr:hypothetical protein [Dictyobacter kobayashii]GCE18350.1 hypothetical protein KDK_21500 [Dictyobacter kobayashii]
MVLDLKQTKDAHVDQRLRKELIIWLSSVKANGRPTLFPSGSYGMEARSLFSVSQGIRRFATLSIILMSRWHWKP